MGYTFTYTDALNSVRSSFPVKDEDAKAAIMCNLALNMIWFGYDWRESLAKLPPFGLVPYTQDYGAPAVSVPADFEGLREAYLLHLTSFPPTEAPILVRSNIKETMTRGLPQVIGYEPTTTSFRTFPRAPGNVGSPEWAIRGTYKKQPTKVTNSNLNSLLFTQDKYFQVWVAGLQWAGTSLSVGSPETKAAAGAEFAFHINKMAMDEGLNNGDQTITPQEPLVGASLNNGGWVGGNGGIFI
jgi:hypothetical protein